MLHRDKNEKTRVFVESDGVTRSPYNIAARDQWGLVFSSNTLRTPRKRVSFKPWNSRMENVGEYKTRLVLAV